MKKVILFLLAIMPFNVFALMDSNITNISVVEGKTTTFTITPNGGVGRVNVYPEDGSVIKVTSTCDSGGVYKNTGYKCWIENGAVTYTVTALKEGSTVINIQYADVTDTRNNNTLVTDTKKINVSVIKQYDLKLTLGTGIKEIYYKVNGASTYSKTTSSTTIKVNNGSSYSVYAVAANDYTYSTYTSSKPYTGTMNSSGFNFSPIGTKKTTTTSTTKTTTTTKTTSTTKSTTTTKATSTTKTTTTTKATSTTKSTTTTKKTTSTTKTTTTTKKTTSTTKPTTTTKKTTSTTKPTTTTKKTTSTTKPTTTTKSSTGTTKLTTTTKSSTGTTKPTTTTTTTKKISETELDTLTINGYDIELKENVFEYYINVSEGIETLNFVGVVNNDLEVTNTGDIDIKNADSVVLNVKNKITNEEKKYTIYINKSNVNITYDKEIEQVECDECDCSKEIVEKEKIVKDNKNIYYGIGIGFIIGLILSLIFRKPKKHKKYDKKNENIIVQDEINNEIRIEKINPQDNNVSNEVVNQEINNTNEEVKINSENLIAPSQQQVQTPNIFDSNIINPYDVK